MSNNLRIWADLTDHCLAFRLAMLRKQRGVKNIAFSFNPC